VQDRRVATLFLVVGLPGGREDHADGGAGRSAYGLGEIGSALFLLSCRVRGPGADDPGCQPD